MARPTKVDGGEQGVISLLTVIFFMIFLSLIVVAYISLVMHDQRQTTDSDLSASALAAARSGVEDGKRILLYCQTTADPHCTTNLLNSGDNCDLFKTGNPGVDIASTLQIPIDPSTGQGATGGAGEYQQYFTCLTIQQDTPYITATVNEGTSFIQKMTTASPFNQLTVSWSGTGTFADRAKIDDWPNVNSWKDVSNTPYAPVIQLQIIPYKTNGFSDLDGIEHQSSTMYIAPCMLSGVGLAASCTPAFTNISLLDQRGATAGQTRVGSVPLTYAGCTTTGSAGYECSITLKGVNGGGSSVWQNYVRASVLYATSTTLKLAASNGLPTNIVPFRNVQPWIDVTGRANDVFRRVRAQVSYSNLTDQPPQFVIDSAAPVCKDMTVTAETTSSTYNCN